MEDYLVHHGIKGMKWGVRRYRNYDGTLTSSGKSRYKDSPRSPSYKRGRRISKVYDQKYGDELDKQIDESKEYSKLTRQKQRLIRDHDLDEYGEIKYWSPKNEQAANRYRELTARQDDLYAQFERRAQRTARDYVAKNYGDMAVSDLNKYNNTNAAIAVTSLIGSVAALSIAYDVLTRKSFGF